MMDFTKDIEESLITLRNGGVILFPTETGWCLGCNAVNPEAVEKLISMKAVTNGMTVLLATERDVLQYAASPDLQVFDYLEDTPGPVTVIYDGGLGVADEVLRPDASIAIRLVKDDFCRHLVKRLQNPLVAVEAGKNDLPVDYKNVSADFINAVDYIVQFRQDNEYAFQKPLLIKFENGEATEIQETF